MHARHVVLGPDLLGVLSGSLPESRAAVRRSVRCAGYQPHEAAAWDNAEKFLKRWAPAWADAGVIVPWTLYTMYGDPGIVRRHFASMTAWMDYLERVNPDYLRTRGLGASYNDWLAPGADDTPDELLATAYWAHDAVLMAEMAEVIGRTDEATRYRALRAKIGAAFAEAFVSAEGRIASGTQTAYVLGLHMRLIPGHLRQSAAREPAKQCSKWVQELTNSPAPRYPAPNRPMEKYVQLARTVPLVAA